MKLSVDRKAFSAALRIASVAISTRTTLPILSGVLLSAKDGRLSLSTTDLDISVATQIDAQVEQVGQTVAPFTLLSGLADRVQDSRVKLVAGKNLMLVECGDVAANLETLPADEFPPDFKMDGAQPVECDCADITRPFAMLEPFISKDQTRYHLMGISLAPGKDGTEFAATNGARLAVFRGKKITDANIIVPDAFVRALRKISPSAGPMAVSISSEAIRLSFGDTQLNGKLIEGTFPNYRNVIPENGSNIFSCRRKELVSAIQTCALFHEPGLSHLTLAGKSKQLEVSKPGKVKARLLGTDLAGQPDFSIQFNARYMIEALGVLEGDETRIQCSDEKSPMKIEEGPFLAVMTPVIPVV